LQNNTKEKYKKNGRKPYVGRDTPRAGVFPAPPSVSGLFEEEEEEGKTKNKKKKQTKKMKKLKMRKKKQPRQRKPFPMVTQKAMME